MSKLKLNLDKQTLVRLQHQQLQAISGGAAEGESSGDKDPDAGFTLAAGDSCCRKTCNGGGDEPSPE